MMRVKVAIGILMLCAVPALASGQCVAPKGNHERWDVKTRAVSKAKPEATTVTALLAEPVPKRPSPLPDVPIAGEDRVLTVTAYVLLAKCSADDGDIHAEIAATASASAPRMIVEIPRADLAVQQQFAEMLGLAKIGTTPHRFTGADAPRVTFTGWAFYDLSHATADGKKKGHAHGSDAVASLLELHPVFRVGK